MRFPRGAAEALAAAAGGARLRFEPGGLCTGGFARGVSDRSTCPDGSKDGVIGFKASHTFCLFMIIMLHTHTFRTRGFGLYLFPTQTETALLGGQGCFDASGVSGHCPCWRFEHTSVESLWDGHVIDKNRSGHRFGEEHISMLWVARLLSFFELVPFFGGVKGKPKGKQKPSWGFVVFVSDNSWAHSPIQNHPPQQMMIPQPPD